VGRRRPGAGAGLTDRQWVALGRFVAALHRAVPPSELTATVAREPFVPWGAAPVRALDIRLGQGRARAGDPVARELAGRWRAHRDTIVFAADRAERLGRVVAAARPELVLCHADLHLANLLVAGEDRLAVVDWDGLSLAPRERDLCFLVTGDVGGHEQTRFFEGYGPAALDGAILAYYRWKWMVQELADYGGRVLGDRLGEGTRREALAEFERLFAAGDVVDVARRVDQDVTIR
jgi:spectinomycin phosphotransferase